MGTIQLLRSCLLYFLLASLTLLWCIPSVIFGLLLPYKWRYRLIGVAWGRTAVWLAKYVAGVNYRVTGAENIPAQPCVILSKHQSTWETFYISSHFYPLSQVLKRELLRIPVFGWALAMINPIALNRSQPKQALRQLAQQGHERLKQGNWLMIFPEGTRVVPGKIGKFSRGGASLAVNADLPVLPIAHNAGHFWPRTGWTKKAGTIDIVIGPAMYAQGTGSRAIAELNQRAYEWIARAQRDIGSLDDEAWAEFLANTEKNSAETTSIK